MSGLRFVRGLRYAEASAIPAIFRKSSAMSTEFRTLLISGRDRVRFLHNFCTADIRGMSPGQCQEAFFTDVRARIAAHGYVLMLEDHLQVWLLGDDPQRLRSHLERYLITEDVLLAEPVDGACLIVNAAELETLPGMPVVAAGVCGQYENSSGRVTGLVVSWGGALTGIFCGAAAAIEQLGQTPQLQPRRLDDGSVQRLRITERFPIIGVDLTLDHLAPEADRNQQAICYTKGCYLGQEPIARIDAMGHINRALRLVRLSVPSAGPDDSVSASEAAGAELQVADGTAAGHLTSSCLVDGELWGLAVLRLASLGQITQAQLSNGRRISAGVP